MALDQKINELDTAPSISNADLVIIGRSADGKLFKSTLSKLRDWLAEPALQKLTAPGLSITLVNTTRIELSLSGDSRTEKHILRLATDAQFATGLRSATVIPPQATYSFTGLTPGTPYYIGLFDKATGFQDSNETTQSVTTHSVAASTTITSSQSLTLQNSWYEAKSGYVHTSALSVTEDVTEATNVDLTYFTNTAGSTLSEIAIYVNSLLHQIVSSIQSGILTISVSLPSGPKIVKMVTGSQQRINDSGEVLGTFIVQKQYNALALTGVATKKDKGLLIIGDSISVGIATINPVTDALVSVLRTKSEMADWDIIADGWGYRGLIPSFGSAVNTAATRIVSALSNYSRREILFALGTNDYGLNYGSPAQAASALSNLIDVIHALDPTITCKVITPYKRSNESANSLGYTLPQYRSAIAGVASGRTYVKVLDGSTIDFLPSSPDGVHPSTNGTNTILVPAVLLFIVPAAGGGIGSGPISSSGFQLAREGWTTNRVAVADNNLSSTSAQIGQTADAYSSYVLKIGQTGEIRQIVQQVSSFTGNVTRKGTGVMALSNGHGAEPDYTSLKCGAYAFEDVLSYIINGVVTNSTTAISDGDVIAMVILSTTISFQVNGVEVTTAPRPSGDLYLKTWFYLSGFKITNLLIKGLVLDPLQFLPVTNGWIVDSVEANTNTLVATGTHSNGNPPSGPNAYNGRRIIAGTTGSVRATIAQVSNGNPSIAGTGILALSSGYLQESTYTTLQLGLHGYEGKLSYTVVGSITNTATNIADGDVFIIELTLTEAVFYLNQTEITRLARPSGDLYLKTWFYNFGYKVTNIQMAGFAY